MFARCARMAGALELPKEVWQPRSTAATYEGRTSAAFKTWKSPKLLCLLWTKQKLSLCLSFVKYIAYILYVIYHVIVQCIEHHLTL